MTTTIDRKNAIVAKLDDEQVFDAFRVLDAQLETDRKNQEVWLVRTWMFEEMERRGMVTDTDDSCLIVVNGTQYDAFTLNPA